jgi:hypothetical protein
VIVLIFHAAAPVDAGPLVGALAEARRALAERQLGAFLAAGADAAEIVARPPDGLSFGERLAAAVRARSAGGAGPGAPGAGGFGEASGRAFGPGGLIVLGSGSIPLATAADLRRFVEVAAGPGRHALANNRYSADVVAISRAEDLAGLPPLPADNALPRWLEERAGVAVSDLRSRWRLGVDIDTPLDLIVLRDPAAGEFHGTAPLIGERLAALTDVLSNRRAELLVAGRVSATTLTWLQRGVACRVRALVEERGLRAASRLAQSGSDGAGSAGTAGATGNSRPPRSVLGELLDRDGPESLAATVARLADAAVIDSRVLMAHRFGPNESAWPRPEDRFASDLSLPAVVSDPWLRALTASAAADPADHPILLGGHTLVNGGLRLLAQRARAGAR